MDFASVTRRRFLRVSAMVSGAAMVGLGGYAGLVEPEELQVERIPIHLPNLAESFDGLKIVQLSDLHYGPFTGQREIGRAVACANAENPDIAVLTGDFITAPIFRRAESLAPVHVDAVACANQLGQLRAPQGLFAVLGNHDFSVNAPFIAETLESRNMRVLSNRSFALERAGARLWLAGVDDALYGRPRLDLALKGIPGGDATILLVHEPDFADFAVRHPVHLQLSGHSHGGQIRIPFLGSPYLPPLSRKYPYGYYRVGPMQLYTNRGIGTILLPLRFDAPPELTVFTLHASPTKAS